jgi:hypothetical protein
LKNGLVQNISKLEFYLLSDHICFQFPFPLEIKSSSSKNLHPMHPEAAPAILAIFSVGKYSTTSIGFPQRK